MNKQLDRLFRVWNTNLAPELLFCSLACGLNALDGPEARDYHAYRWPSKGSVGIVEAIVLRQAECYGCGLRLAETAEEHNSKLDRAGRCDDGIRS